MSVTTNTHNTGQVKKWEEQHYPSPISDRLFALKYLRKKGYRTWGSGEPPLPGTIIDQWLDEVIDAGPEEFWVGKPNYVPGLTSAFDWQDFANAVLDYRSRKETTTKIFLKPDLLKYATDKVPVLIGS